jgi:hypothetical protein
MSYSHEQVVAMTRAVNPTVAASIGQAEGSTTSAHVVAIEFWEAALALEGDEALAPDVAALANAEIARHQAALGG